MTNKTAPKWTIGSISEFPAKYVPLNEWCHGVDFVEVDQDAIIQPKTKPQTK